MIDQRQYFLVQIRHYLIENYTMQQDEISFFCHNIELLFYRMIACNKKTKHKLMID
jgi:hypothetical protein